MLNAEQTNEAINALTLDRTGTHENKIAAHQALRLRTKELEAEFKEYLETMHASTHSIEEQELIWDEALRQADGSGYYVIEDTYEETANFLNRIKMLTQ